MYGYYIDENGKKLDLRWVVFSKQKRKTNMDELKPSHIGGRYIHVEVDKVGETKIEAHGFTGGTCKQATKPLEDALGAKDVNRVVKSADCEVKAENVQAS